VSVAAGKRAAAGEQQRRQETDERVLAEFTAVEAELDRRWPESTLEPSLDRISALVDLLGDPQRAYPVVHLAGTNGKSSTARMVDALLTEAGLRTGRYTSPHLQLATERICLDGAPIGMQRYVEVYREVEP
jgi:dihydrofolate synthase/folylpolyglutamate synthase